MKLSGGLRFVVEKMRKKHKKNTRSNGAKSRSNEC